jgi:hypothetical protein
MQIVNNNNDNNTKSLLVNLSSIPGFNELLYHDNEINVLKLNKIESRTNNNQSYKVITYDKNLLNNELVSIYGYCRSIIANSDNKVVCFAPQKSISAYAFIDKYPNKTIDIVAEEFVEGTMINVFWDEKIGLTGGWEIATRNTVGATSSFYKSSNKTFREMFLEAAKECNLNLDTLNALYCYSFVLQHPSNRIVVPFEKPNLYLIGVYHIDNSDMNNISIYRVNMSAEDIMSWYKTNVKFPQIYSWDNYTELITSYGSMNTSYDVLGVVLINFITGERTKIRNPVYEEVRSLRGNQPKLQYQYLCLRKEGKIGDFLKYYPENKNEFSAFRDQIHLFTNTLFSNYISCYIKKETQLIGFSKQYRGHLYNLHQMYINELREQKLFVTNRVVINYVNNLHPSLLMYSLNYNMRKRNLDFVSLEIIEEV